MKKMTLFEALVVMSSKKIVIVHTELDGGFYGDGSFKNLESKEISREEITSKDVYIFKNDERGKMHVVSIKPIDAETIEICYTSEE